jgi:hypothetical protein
VSGRRDVPLSWWWARLVLADRVAAPNTADVVVALVIASHLNERSGESRPSLTTLADETRLHRVTVVRVIGRLELAGLLEVDRASGRVNVYRVSDDTRRMRLPVASGDQSHTRSLRQPERRTKTSEVFSDENTSAAATGRAAAKESSKKRRGRRRDPLFEALCAACEINATELTKNGRGAVNGALRQLREVGADAAQVRRRAAAYRERFPHATLTAPALAKHWAELGPAGSGEPPDDGEDRGLEAMRAIADERGLSE